MNLTDLFDLSFVDRRNAVALEFEGQATAYTKAPFMLTLSIGEDENKTKIIGWKPVAAPPTSKKAAPSPKKQP